MKPTRAGSVSPGSSLVSQRFQLCVSSPSRCSTRWKNTSRAAQTRQCGRKKKSACFYTVSLSEPPPQARINKSALWTSVSVCIMDDVADGP